MIRISKEEARTGRIISTYDPEKKQNRRMKYGNQRIETEDGWFDSMKEANRYEELKLMEQAQIITRLKRQVPFELLPACDRYKRPLFYIADFTYYKIGADRLIFVAEDVKSAATAKDKTYKIKKRMMYQILGIKIQEV